VRTPLGAKGQEGARKNGGIRNENSTTLKRILFDYPLEGNFERENQTKKLMYSKAGSRKRGIHRMREEKKKKRTRNTTVSQKEEEKADNSRSLPTDGGVAAKVNDGLRNLCCAYCSEPYFFEKRGRIYRITAPEKRLSRLGEQRDRRNFAKHWISSTLDLAGWKKKIKGLLAQKKASLKGRTKEPGLIGKRKLSHSSKRDAGGREVI